MVVVGAGLRPAPTKTLDPNTRNGSEHCQNSLVQIQNQGTNMKIAIGTDHAGFELKQALVKHLQNLGHQVQDVGAYTSEASDYPIYGEKVAKLVAAKEADRGIVVCGNGIGMCITANKVPGVRCALVFTDKMARDTRDHNDSNVLSLAGRDMPVEINLSLVDTWLSTPFSRGERHARRIQEISAIEKEYLKGN